MSSVLGKRQRSGDNITTRPKRISVASKHIDIRTDENSDPLASTTPQTRKATVVLPTPRKAATSPAHPAKHATPGSHVKNITTSTIDAHFSVSKSVASPLVQTAKLIESKTASAPSTPRHRDTLARKVLITPKHRLSTPRARTTPRTPRLSNSPSEESSENVYTRARQLFCSRSDTNSLVGRDDERTRLSDFVSSRLKTSTGGCLYVSGPPGTGKSAFVERVLADLKASLYHNLATTAINCMSVKTLKDLTKRLSEGLEHVMPGGPLTDFDCIRSILVEGSPNATSVVVVLDEIDRLVDLDLKALYTLFEWSMQKSSRLILIGIANALDLTDRLLPRLKSRDIKPDLLPFMPYTAPQIEKILTTKLKSLVSDDLSNTDDYVPIIQPSALTLCSKKVAAHIGDLRKAFDICTRAVDLIERETKANESRLTLADNSPSKSVPLSEVINLSSPTIAKPTRQLRLSCNLGHLTCQTAPRATIAHMAKITSIIFGNGITQRLSALNIQQKAVLCALTGMEERKRNLAEANRFSTPSKRMSMTTAPTIKQLYDMYSSLCRRESLLHPLSRVEFRDVVSGLETLSLVSTIVQSKAGAVGSFELPATPSRTPSRRGRAALSFGCSGDGGMASMADEKHMACSVGRKELLGNLQGPGSEMLIAILEGAELVLQQD